MACPESFVAVRRALIDDGSRPFECRNVFALAHVKLTNVSVLRGLPVAAVPTWDAPLVVIQTVRPRRRNLAQCTQIPPDACEPTCTTNSLTTPIPRSSKVWVDELHT